MATIQKGFNMNWEDKIQVQKGNIGEQLVNEFLVGKNYIPYSPDVAIAHPFDRLVASKDKKRIFIADVKAKAKRRAYPDTGINVSHYNEYKYISIKYGIEVFIFFVDEENEMIYGNTLKNLDKPQVITVRDAGVVYPWVTNGIRYFPMMNMINIATIPRTEVLKMRELTTKNPKYLQMEQKQIGKTTFYKTQSI